MRKVHQAVIPPIVEVGTWYWYIPGTNRTWNMDDLASLKRPTIRVAFTGESRVNHGYTCTKLVRWVPGTRFLWRAAHCAICHLCLPTSSPPGLVICAISVRYDYSENHRTQKAIQRFNTFHV